MSGDCASCLKAALEVVLRRSGAPGSSLDVSPSALDCSLGLGLPAYLVLSIFSCVRTDCSNRSHEGNKNHGDDRIHHVPLICRTIFNFLLFG